ncbi:alternative oxidase [Leptolyngbya sp. NIES-2104]|uniref:alternative oxidase n=1 Tax=Leptolyngbya sp. NIES-2104 TaxID=1552121 RepID=UPI0006ECC1DC|nr:alternative oxidase [Leptolyngbya sp. NIES-2104]GAP99903.1 plastoquinol terminal oxidase [Leptolyngbya sp. NIES-2104]
MKVLIRAIVSFFVFVVDGVYGNRSYARFYVLETIARVPYFSYLSVLHLYETLGYWRKADWLKVHFAETWNELHHLLIMESLGGNRLWIDRFVAEHIAVAYYWVVVPLYMVLPKYAYYLMELIESHAYHTYDDYLNNHEAALKEQPAPQVAIDYYRDGDLYMFEEFQTTPDSTFRRPHVDTLYDVFVNIRDDECEHVKTMVALQQPDARLTFKSPHTPVKVVATSTTNTN